MKQDLEYQITEALRLYEKITKKYPDIISKDASKEPKFIPAVTENGIS